MTDCDGSGRVTDKPVAPLLCCRACGKLFSMPAASFTYDRVRVPKHRPLRERVEATPTRSEYAKPY